MRPVARELGSVERTGSGELVQIPLLLGVLALPSLNTRAWKIERNLYSSLVSVRQWHSTTRTRTWGESYEVRAGGEAEKIMRWRWRVILLVGRVRLRVRVLVYLRWCEERWRLMLWWQSCAHRLLHWRRRCCWRVRGRWGKRGCRRWRRQLR